MTNKQDIDIQLPHAYRCREYQAPFWEAGKEGYKRFVLVWHRRAGKEKTCWNYLIMQAVKKVGIYYYFFPHFSQGRKILWDGVDKDGFRLLDHLPKELIHGNPNSTEMKIRLRNGSLIQIIGTNNIDSIVGTNPIGCVFTEYSLQDPTAWQLIRPILVENGGWAVFNFTPRGSNHGKDIYDMASNNPEWFCQLLTVADTRIISEADIQAERDAGMSEDFIQQEFYCSFTLGIEGSYYAKYMQEARDEGRLGNIPWDKQSRVFTSWDLGYGDSCAIIFYQISGQEIHIIDYYENHGEGLPHYVSVLKERPYVYADHFAPHDIESHAFSSGLSAREVGANLGIRFITLPTLKLRIEDGIEALRGLFPRIWIDATKCKQLIKCLENYRKEFDQRLETYKERPRHDKYSHGCFTGETIITCKDGLKRIDQVKQGDLVLTPMGHRAVTKVFEYETSHLVKIATTSAEITCTPNHKIFTNHGLIYADAIRYNATIYTTGWLSRWITWARFGLISLVRSIGFRESFLLAKTHVSSCLVATSSGGTVFTIGVDLQEKTLTKDYTSACGRFITAQYRMGIISTTLTTILKTTTLKILSAFQPAIIQRCTPEHPNTVQDLKSLLSRLWSMLKSGTPVPRGSIGTKSTPLRWDLGAGTVYQKPVNSVWPSTERKITTRDFVQMLAKPRTGIFRGLMRKIGLVKFVGLCSKLTSMLLKERVVSVVPLSSQITQKVYDFEVEKDHCYYANGILVSNSDAARYMAIAVRRHVDAGKAGVTDEQSEKWFKQFNPRFD